MDLGPARDPRILGRDVFGVIASHLGPQTRLVARHVSRAWWQSIPKGRGNLIVYAARRGRLELLKWAAAQGCPYIKRVGSNAAIGGHFEILLYLKDLGFKFDDDACSAAAMGGHLKILKWLVALDPEHKFSAETGLNSRSVCAAAQHGQLEILKWLASKGARWYEITWIHAMQSGSWETLKWLFEKKWPWDLRACGYAVRLGRLDLLKWLRARGCPWGSYSYMWEQALIRGDLEILDWLRDNGCKWSDDIWEHVNGTKVKEWAKSWVQTNATKMIS